MQQSFSPLPQGERELYPPLPSMGVVGWMDVVLVKEPNSATF
ncbi:MAG: hypothetical protein WCG31_07905 [Deltaproteobacteria bacterium]